MVNQSINCFCSTPSPMQFFQSYSGMAFTIKNGNNSCKVYAPNFKNIYHTKVPANSGSLLTFKDSWTTNTLLVTSSTEKIDNITLQNLWEYANSNLSWDEITEQLSFKDVEVSEISLYDFVKDVDSFLAYNKLTKFGNVWWYGRVVSDLEGVDSRNINVNIPNVSGYGFGSGGATDLVSFWSPDKYINDEYKKYLNDSLNYNGVINSTDYGSNGWFSVPDLVISTKPFEKLKIAQIILNLNYTFDPSFFGKYYTVDSTLGTRIKDSTSDTVFDISETKSNQNTGSFTDTVINHWIGGLVSTANLSTIGTLGTFKSGSCDSTQSNTQTNISHLISSQISLNTAFDPNKKEVTGTIDPINWKSSEQFYNSRKIGILNVDRAFGGACGTSDSAIIIGGINKSDNFEPVVLDSVEIWNSIGFLKNINVKSNNKRSFHLQGGDSASKSAVLFGGFSSFNKIDSTQFSEYGKTDVRNDMEIFIKSDNAATSYFKRVPSVTLNIGRGDAAGAITVKVKDRQDKFEAEDMLKTFVTNKTDEQRVAEFVENNSGSGNAKRYTILNVDGFIYGGNSSGNSYLTSQSTGDILNSFERISTIFVEVGDELLSKQNTYTGNCIERVQDVLTIDCKNSNGAAITVPKCGRYRIKYVSGAGRKGV